MYICVCVCMVVLEILCLKQNNYALYVQMQVLLQVLLNRNYDKLLIIIIIDFFVFLLDSKPKALIIYNLTVTLFTSLFSNTSVQQKQYIFRHLIDLLSLCWCLSPSHY